MVAPCHTKQTSDYYQYSDSDEIENTHDDVFDDPETGSVKIFTLIIATSPSTAFVPFAPTLR